MVSCLERAGFLPARLPSIAILWMRFSGWGGRERKNEIKSMGRQGSRSVQIACLMSARINRAAPTNGITEPSRDRGRERLFLRSPLSAALISADSERPMPWPNGRAARGTIADASAAAPALPRSGRSRRSDRGGSEHQGSQAGARDPGRKIRSTLQRANTVRQDL